MTNSDELTDWMTLAGTAKYLQISTSKLYKMAQNKKIPGRKIDKQWRFNKDEINTWMMKESENQSTPAKSIKINQHNSSKTFADASYLKEVINSLTLEKTIYLKKGRDEWIPNSILKKGIKTFLNNFIMSIGGKISKESPRPDCIALEIERPVTASEGREYEAPFVRVFSGILGRDIEEDVFYKKFQRFLFYNWIPAAPLRVRIVGNNFKWSELNSLSENEIVVSLETIDKAFKLYKKPEMEEKRIDYILNYSQTGDFPNVISSRNAAKIVLNSTLYNRELMKEPESWRLNIREVTIEELRLPHKDQRNIAFIPGFVRNEPIGGVAVYSHEPLSEDILHILSLAVNIILLRIRMADEYIENRLSYQAQAKWQATLIYVHRLAHDVRKPLDEVRYNIKHFLSKEVLQGNDAREFLARLNNQLENFSATLSSRLFDPEEGLRQQAILEASLTDLTDFMESATWNWKLYAEKQSKRLEWNIEGHASNLINIPRHLVIEALGNLISNACRFAKQKVTVLAEVKQTENGARQIKFIVKDDGPGMEESLLQKVYESTKIEKLSIPGKGLFLTQFIVKELLYGNLEFDSPPGGGLTVHLSFFEFEPIGE